MSEILNILCCNPNGGAFYYITKGWENAFVALGHKFERWDGTDDHLKKFKPHMYLGCSGWRQNFPQWAKDEYGTRIAIHVNPWGTTVLKALKGEPNINEPKGAIDWVTKQNPDFLYCYGLQNDIDHMWNKWEDNVCAVVPMPNGGDAISYHKVEPDPFFHCDVGFIGGYWPYKAMNLRKYLTPVIDSMTPKQIQIFGWGGWKHIGNKYKGTIKNEVDVSRLFSSAKICPSVVEPHTSRYGIDIPERMFKVPLGGGFTILDPCAGIERYISKDVFPIAKNPKDYVDLIKFYLANDQKRIELKTKQRLAILKDHTYFSRIQGFLRFGRYSSAADEAQKKVDELCSGITTN